MKFNSLQDLTKAFTSGSLTTLPDDIVIDGILYDHRGHTKFSADEMFITGKKGYVVYRVNRTKSDTSKIAANAEAEGPQPILLLVWATTGLSIHPVGAKFTTDARKNQVMAEASEKKKDGPRLKDDHIQINQDDIIKDQADVLLSRFNHNQPILGKIDTGADISSLHATNISIDEKDPHDKRVTFEYEGTKYGMPLYDTHAVQTADNDDTKNNIEYRPVVLFDIKLGNRLIKYVEVNLNDRTHMSHKLLLGKNFIDKGKFIIANHLKDNFDADVENMDLVEKDIETAYNLMIEQNISITDLLKYAKASGILAVDQLQP